MTTMTSTTIHRNTVTHAAFNNVAASSGINWTIAVARGTAGSENASRTLHRVRRRSDDAVRSTRARLRNENPSGTVRTRSTVADRHVRRNGTYIPIGCRAKYRMVAVQILDRLDRATAPRRIKRKERKDAVVLSSPWKTRTISRRITTLPQQDTKCQSHATQGTRPAKRLRELREERKRKKKTKKMSKKKKEAGEKRRMKLRVNGLSADPTSPPDHRFSLYVLRS